MGGGERALKTPNQAEFSGVVKQGVAGAEIGKVRAGHGEAFVADIEIESGLDGVGEAGGELPGKVPLVGGVGTDFGQGGA